MYETENVSCAKQELYLDLFPCHSEMVMHAWHGQSFDISTHNDTESMRNFLIKFENYLLDSKGSNTQKHTCARLPRQIWKKKITWNYGTQIYDISNLQYHFN